VLYSSLQSPEDDSSISASLNLNDDDEDHKELSDEDITDRSLEYLANLINHRLDTLKNGDGADNDSSPSDINTEKEISNNSDDKSIAYQLAKGRFIDLTTTLEDEQTCENLFLHSPSSSSLQLSSQSTQIRIIQHAITTLQSLLIYGMQIGVKGSEEHQKKLIRHLFRRSDPPMEPSGTWIDNWNSTSIRRLKFYRDISLGKQLLAKLIRKRTAQGAFDLLIDLQIWNRHVDTALLRSGFPIRFTNDELQVAQEAANNSRDPDGILDIRQDLRYQKVYTIDSASTFDIDDGISVEKLDTDDSTTRYRYWIHIADVDRYASRDSSLLKVAERRGTSLYLPTKTITMFPSCIENKMSLESGEDRCALSLGVELHSNGTIIPSSIILTSSLINVQYRLTYDDVDEMLDEGVGYTEEWQIGVLLDAARKRREHRVSKGSTEGMVPYPIPSGQISAKPSNDGSSTDEYDISLKIETSHNSGANITSSGNDDDLHYDPYCSPISSSQLIVTEMMILGKCF